MCNAVFDLDLDWTNNTLNQAYSVNIKSGEVDFGDESEADAGTQRRRLLAEGDQVEGGDLVSSYHCLKTWMQIDRVNGQSKRVS